MVELIRNLNTYIRLMPLSFVAVGYEVRGLDKSPMSLVPVNQSPRDTDGLVAAAILPLSPVVL